MTSVFLDVHVSQPLCNIEQVSDYSIFKCTWPDSEQLNDALKDVILQEEQTTVTKHAGGVGTWISQFATQGWGGSAVESVMERATSMLEVCVNRNDINELWAVIYRSGAYFYPHTHPRSRWSGIYYVDPGDHESGHTVFVKDGTQLHGIDRTEWSNAEHHTVVPEAGSMLVFPSDLLHYVEEYQGESPRIVIPFNAGSSNELSND